MEPSQQQHSKRYIFTLSLSALGVVYGDIGTSPLYALRECFYGIHGIAASHDNVLGVCSIQAQISGLFGANCQKIWPDKLTRYGVRCQAPALVVSAGRQVVHRQV